MSHDDESISMRPSKEFVIDTIRRLGVKTVYPKTKRTADEVIAHIEQMPDSEWYPPNDVFWQEKRSE
jgi:hypothetical protein